jgi:hypothetical protein
VSGDLKMNTTQQKEHGDRAAFLAVELPGRERKQECMNI